MTELPPETASTGQAATSLSTAASSRATAASAADRLPSFDDRLRIMNDERFPAVEKMFLAIRGMIEHEDQLINYRNSWFISLNSFLFGSVSLIGTSSVWASMNSAERVVLPFESSALCALFAFVGLISCVSTLVSVRAAYNAIRALEKHWTYSYEPTVAGFSTGRKHHLDDRKRVTSSTGELLAYDPEVIFPFIVGGGPFKRSVVRGKVASYGVVVSVALLWSTVFGYCGWSLFNSLGG
jgi:hypothetical protein